MTGIPLTPAWVALVRSVLVVTTVVWEPLQLLVKVEYALKHLMEQNMELKCKKKLVDIQVEDHTVGSCHHVFPSFHFSIMSKLYFLTLHQPHGTILLVFMMNTFLQEVSQNCISDPST